MQIINKNTHRILVKDNGSEVDITDEAIIQYTGIYYKHINDIIRRIEIETTFIGIVEGEKSRHDSGIIGIYVKPLYIWNIMHGEWNKINNFTIPKTKYFLYPHLLTLPNYTYADYHLNYLMTCENKSIHELTDVNKEFTLDAQI